MNGQCFLCWLRSASAPSPCKRLSRSLSTMSRSDSQLVISLPVFMSASLTSLQTRNELGLPSSLVFLFTHATLFDDPGRPSATSPLRLLCVGFWIFDSIAVCFLGLD